MSTNGVVILGAGPIGLDAAPTRLDAGYRLAKQAVVLFKRAGSRQAAQRVSSP